MGRMVAIAGGSLASTELLNKYALDLTGSEKPKALFIPTASRDNPSYINEFKEAFEKLGAEVDVLAVVKDEPSEKELDKKINWADLIYVGGGNTVFMMNKWKDIGLDEKLRNVFANNSAVLTGNGAGCSCWFTCGYSNSEYYNGRTDWQYIWADNLLDFHHAAVCPHYNDEGRANFDIRLIEKEIPGYALEDNVALVQNGYHTEIIACHPKAKAYYLVYLNGNMLRQEIELIYINDTEA